MRRGQAFTRPSAHGPPSTCGMGGAGWGGAIRREIPGWGELVGRGGGKSGFVGTSLFRASQVLLRDFSHSTLAWGPEAQSVDG